jgi:tRNA G37 N-methylase TrmD
LRTRQKRPDLLKEEILSSEDRKLLAEAVQNKED